MRRPRLLLWAPFLLSAGCADGASSQPGGPADPAAAGTDGAETDAPGTDSSGAGSASGSSGAAETGLPPETGGEDPCMEGDACPPGSACDGPGACASGFCAEGICCDTACDGACDSCSPAGICGPVDPMAQPECASGASQWVMGLGAPVDVEEAPNSNFDRGTSMAFDDAGNVYISGTFNQQIDFGGGVLVAAGGDDAFVASFSPDGTYRWANRFGNTGHDTGGGVAVVPGTNEVVIVGAATGDPGFQGNWPESGLRGFVVKVTADAGTVVASRAIDASEFSRALSVDAGASGIYVAGGYSGTLELGTQRISVGDEDLFALHLDGALEPQWNWSDGNTDKDLGRAIAVSPTGDVALCGFISSPGKVVNATQDIMVAGFTAPLAAAPSWRRLYASPADGQAKGHSVAWTADGGDVMAAGFYVGPVTFDQMTPDGGARDGVLLRLNGATGSTVWAQTFGGLGNDNARDVAVDAAGNVFVSGDFSESLTLGPPIASAGGSDTFVAKFTSDGTHLWSRGYGGTSNDNGNGIGVAPDGSLYATGHFRETTTFDGVALTAAEGADAFLMRLTP